MSRGAAALQAMIVSAGRERAATLVGTGTLLIASTAVFVELQAALNVIWKVQRRQRRALIAAAREQLLSLSLILALGFLLLVSLVLSAALSRARCRILSMTGRPGKTPSR